MDRGREGGREGWKREGGREVGREGGGRYTFEVISGSLASFEAMLILLTWLGNDARISLEQYNVASSISRGYAALPKTWPTSTPSYSHHPRIHGCLGRRLHVRHSIPLSNCTAHAPTYSSGSHSPGLSDAHHMPTAGPPSLMQILRNLEYGRWRTENGYIFHQPQAN